jgi:uncharacterized protein (TIGR00299 family) protein
MLTGRCVAWVDASAGVAGDMLLGALVDAGACLSAVQGAVDAVLPGAVRLRTEEVTRAGVRATRLRVDLVEPDSPHRTWMAVRSLVEGASLVEPVRESAVRVFERLAGAEARVHAMAVDEVHFHEVGALDSIADVVGSCAALYDLGIGRLVVSTIALGSGRIRSSHGDVPVPVPAVLELARGWQVSAGGEGELATPTGMALLTALGAASGPLPTQQVERVGVGAGSKAFPDRANVVRVVVGSDIRAEDADNATELVIEANVDDLDPRLWPTVMAAVLEAGAADAWLTPILMKKGRPAHTLHVLATPERARALQEVIFTHTTTIGIRSTVVAKTALSRTWVDVELLGGTVPIKVAHRGGVIVSATPEFEDVAALAAATGQPVRAVLARASAAATQAGLEPGAAI